MSGLSIDTNSSGKTDFPDHRIPGENPSEHDLRLFRSTLNGPRTNNARSPVALNLRRDVFPGGSDNGLDRMVQARAYPPTLSTVEGSPQHQAVLSQMVADFKRQFTELAQSPKDFHQLLSQAFGTIDADRAEALACRP